MALVFHKPILVDFDGVTIEQTATFVMSDHLYNKTNKTIEYTVVMSSGATIAAVREDICNYFGFNPFRMAPMLITNRPGYTWNDVSSRIKKVVDGLAIDYTYLPNSGVQNYFTNIRTVDGISLNVPSGSILPGFIYSANQIFPIGYEFAHMEIVNGGDFSVDVYVYPERVYDHGEFDPDIAQPIKIHIIATAVSDDLSPLASPTYSRLQFIVTETTGTSWKTFIEAIASSTVQDATTDSTSNPYVNGLPTSTTGGGDGDYTDPTETEKMGVPDLPDIDAVTSGLLTIYAPSQAQLNSLGAFLWGVNFDINDLKKLFADPMSAIIGLSIVPVTPTLGGTKEVKFGDISTGVSMPYVSNQFTEVQMGSVAVKKQVGCFMDYAPYTQIDIYLPGIGMRSLSPDDVMGTTLTVTYHVDVVTGACVAYIDVSTKGVLYQFTGSLIENIPVTAANYSGAIQNAVTSGISMIGTVAGAATGNAPLTIASGTALATNAANTAINSKPTVERSGNVSGTAGIMSIKQPYLVITRPRMSVANNLNRFTGNTLNVTCKLSNVKGFTMIELIHLDGIPCTENERAELETLLHQGVIF